MYSKDLIKSVINYYNNNNTTYKETARIFNISISSIRRWLHNNIPIGIRQKKITNYYNSIQELISKNPLITHNEIKFYLNNKISIGSINKIIKNINYTIKKINYNNFYKNIDTKNKNNVNFCKKITNLNEYISIDETYFNSNVRPTYGYSLKGKKLFLENKIIIKKYSLLMAISSDKIIDYEIIDGNIDSNIFSKFIDRLPNNTKLLLDNVSFHKTKNVKYISNKKNIELQFIPPYTPEVNPIEYVFSIIKHYYKKIKFNDKLMIDNIKKSINNYKYYDFSNIYKNITNKYLKF